MARQNKSKQAEEPQATAAAEPTEPQAPESTEATPEVNLDAFKAAVASVLGDADPATGVMPEAAKATVNEEYRKLEGQKPKNAARSFLEDSMLEAVGELNAPLARSYNELKGGLSAGTSAGTPKAPADPVAAQVNREATLRLALALVVAQRPETDRDLDAEVQGVVDNSEEDVAKLREFQADESEDKGDAPEVSPIVRAAFKAAQGKSSGARSGGSGGPRKDIGKHIREAFADVEPGTFRTMAEIAKFKSTEYPDSPPSQGAISARLFPRTGTCTVEGVEPVDKTSDHPKGARKAA
jgi:hypothetical protein